MQKYVNLVDLVKRFKSLSISLLLNLLFEPDPYSNEYLLFTFLVHLFTCKHRRRYSRDRASQSLELTQCIDLLAPSGAFLAPAAPSVMYDAASGDYVQVYTVQQPAADTSDSTAFYALAFGAAALAGYKVAAMATKGTVVIGLAADSGCGKSTFMRRMTSIFGGEPKAPEGGNPESNTLLSDKTTVLC